MAVSYYVGVSGFSYPSWRGRFYPKEMKGEEFLAFYSQRLKSVEINSSFYASPGPAMVKGWAARTGEGFRFAFKAPRQITHVLKLRTGSAEAAGRLSQVLELLGERRGPVLFQLAPYTRADLQLLERFLSETSGIRERVFEFRHASWLEQATYKALERHGAGFCVAETEEMKPVFEVTGGVAYFRLRKESYDAEAMDRWAKKVGEVAGSSKEAYVYLRHDESGENAILAQRLSKKLG